MVLCSFQFFASDPSFYATNAVIYMNNTIETHAHTLGGITPMVALQFFSVQCFKHACLGAWILKEHHTQTILKGISKQSQCFCCSTLLSPRTSQSS